MTSNQIPLVHLEGKARERGKQLIQQAYQKVVQHIKNIRENIEKKCPSNPWWWRDIVLSFVPLFEKHAPHFLEEIRGACEESGLSFEEMLLINTRDEIANFLPEEDFSSFACEKEFTGTSHPLSGQTKDTNPISADLYIIMRLVQDEGPSLLVLAYAGEFCGMGISSSGMSVYGNSIFLSGTIKKGTI